METCWRKQAEWRSGQPRLPRAGVSKGHANIVCYSDWEISPVTQLQMSRLQQRVIKTCLLRASGWQTKCITLDCRRREGDGDSDWQPAEIIQRVSVTGDENTRAPAHPAAHPHSSLCMRKWCARPHPFTSHRHKHSWQQQTDDVKSLSFCLFFFFFPKMMKSAFRGKVINLWGNMYHLLYLCSITEAPSATEYSILPLIGRVNLWTPAVMSLRYNSRRQREGVPLCQGK